MTAMTPTEYADFSREVHRLLAVKRKAQPMDRTDVLLTVLTLANQLGANHSDESIVERAQAFLKFIDGNSK